MTFNGHSRHWLLTWRTYGTWLPGDPRGFVGAVVTAGGTREIRNVSGTPCAEPSVNLQRYARSVMRADAVLLEPAHAIDVFSQLRETTVRRGWVLVALAVLTNHVHAVVRVEGDPDGAVLLRDLKSYASRRLSDSHGKPAAGSWWSESGSRRVLRDEKNIRAAIEYVRNQAGALFVWTIASDSESVGIDIS